MAATGLNTSGSYLRAIEELLVSDFIAESPPFGKKKRGTMYRLTDEYSIFYHRFIKQTKYTPGIWQQFTQTRKQVFLTLITNLGITPNAYSAEIVDAEITLENLVAG